MKNNFLRETYPELYEQLDISKNIAEYQMLNIPAIATCSNKYLYWKCPTCGGVYKTSPKHRVIDHRNCPYCSHRRVTTGKTDLQTLFPNIAKEWDYKKNYPVTPDKVLPMSHKKYWWICSKGHSYQASPSNRCGLFRGCPECCHRKSAPELTVFEALKKNMDKNVISGYREHKFELDIFSKKYKTGVEYDGKKYHGDDKKKSEERKNTYYLKQNISVIRIKETDDFSKIGISKKYKNCTVFYIYNKNGYDKQYFRQLNVILKDIIKYISGKNSIIDSASIYKNITYSS